MKRLEMMKQQNQRGFTLIELMIVVAIIGILAAVAIPQYRDYTIRAKIANAITSVDSVKTAVALCVQENGGVSGCDAGTNGIPATADFTPTKEVASLNSVTNGVITIQLATGIANDVDNATITFTPNPGNTAVTWNATTSSQNTVARAVIEKNNIAGNGGNGGNDGGDDGGNNGGDDE